MTPRAVTNGKDTSTAVNFPQKCSQCLLFCLADAKPGVTIAVPVQEPWTALVQDQLARRSAEHFRSSFQVRNLASTH